MATVKILIANPRGFCAGVHMAIDVVDQLLELCPDEPVFVYHEIVHNRHIVDRFCDQGVTFVDDLDEVPEGALLVFSAHGVSPQVQQHARERRLIAIDATCPLVTKVHMEAIRYAAKGYQILLIGHENHQEVIGTIGQAPDAIQVVESPDDIANLRIDDPAQVVYLTQTTLSVDDAEVIIAALRDAFPGIKSPPTDDICYATTNRQHAVRTLAPSCDVVLVVGSRNSSNSKRLTEIARSAGTAAYLIDDASEVDHTWIDGVDTVLVTAGASAPEDLVRELVLSLVQHYDAVVEQVDVRHESIEFGLPLSLKREMTRRGTDPTGRRIQFDSAKALEQWLTEHNVTNSRVDLTIGHSEAGSST